MKYMILQNSPWHSQAMFMGVHWLWWSFAVFTCVALVWALWRSLSDTHGTRRAAAVQLSAEDALRERFAKGEVDEDEYIKLIDAWVVEFAERFAASK